MWVKKKKYIKELVGNITRKVKYPVGVVKTTHHKLLEINWDDLPLLKKRNPYQVFRDWLLENIGKGILVTYVYVIWFGWSGWLKSLGLVLAFGLGWYIMIRIIQEISNAIRRE